MISHRRSLSVLVVAAGILPAVSAHAGNGTIVVTRPVVCESPFGCKAVHNVAQTYQHISIKAPAAGTITAMISAYGLCSNFGNQPKRVFVDTQLVTTPGAVVNPGGEGGKRMAASLPASQGAFNYTVTNALDTFRTIAVTKAGTYSFYFRFQGTGLNTDTPCELIGGNMTATFVPK